MKRAILSDVHSNLEALTAVREHALAHGAARFICLGDCVGYGADPGPALDLLMGLPGLVCVRGNHDEALFTDTGRGTSEIAQAIAWTRARLSAAQLAFLAQAPYVYQEGRATYAHASAHAPERWDYLYDAEQAGPCMQAAGRPLTFLGHTHTPKVFYETAGGSLRELTPLPGEAIPLARHARYVINVGSVGQPRDGNSAACYVLYDEDAAEVTFHRLAYDTQAAGAKIRAAGLSTAFAERLAHGR
jgi:diadenosine tetraphosphatase ApaH/serine/threonine PP2A family protein phosphatase